jgi:HAD superfamily hydrolase (TIGR01509 family)
MATTDTTQKKYETLTLLSAGDFKAFLYDCDGTLADTMPLHTKAYVRVAAAKGVLIEESIIDEFAGLPVANVVEQINIRYNSNFNPVAFAEEREDLFLNEYLHQTQPVEYVVNHLKAHAGKVKIAVVSGSKRGAVEKTLEILGIAHIPQVLVCAGETPKGKPFPDPFLAAAEKLGVLPQDCLVFEDGDPGTKAAEAAGMRWVRIDKV